MSNYKKVRISILLLTVVFFLPSCGDTSSVKKVSGADSLEDVDIESPQDKDIVEYQDIYIDPEVIVRRKKFWSSYKKFASTLDVGEIDVSVPDSKKRVSSILGDKKLVMITPAIWEDTSHFLVQDGDRKNTREYRIFDTLGDFYIQSSKDSDETSPNGKAALSKWVWGYENTQDVFMDIFVAPPLGGDSSTSDSDKDSVSTGKWSKLGEWSNDVVKKSNSLYLVIAFPLHNKNSCELLSQEESIKIQKLQRGIQNYILKGANLLFPFGSSIDSFFSKELSKISSQLVDPSYQQIATISFAMETLLTQYRAITEDVFCQMSGRISDGFLYSNDSGLRYYPPGTISHSLTYSIGGAQDLSIVQNKNGLFATRNSILVVPFLIRNTIAKKGDFSKKGFLLRGNPLAMRVLSVPFDKEPSVVSLPEGLTHISPSITEKIDFEKSTMEYLSKFSNGKIGEAQVSTTALGFAGLLSIFSSPNSKKKSSKKEAENVKKVEKENGFFEVAGTTTNDAVIWNKQSLSEKIRKEIEGSFHEFSWSNIRKLLEEDESRPNILKAKKSFPKNFSNEDFEPLFDWRKGVTKHANIADHSVAPILEYAGFDLIFWPEDDLGYVKSAIDFTP